MTEEQLGFLSQTQLQDLSDRVITTKTWLLHGLSTSTPDQQYYLETQVKGPHDICILYELLTSFRRALPAKEKLRNWSPAHTIERIIQACCDERYEEHDIEHIFYTHGGITALVVLYFGTKDQSRRFPQILALPSDMVIELAKICEKIQLGCTFINSWDQEYNKSNGTTLSSINFSFV